MFDGMLQDILGRPAREELTKRVQVEVGVVKVAAPSELDWRVQGRLPSFTAQQGARDTRPGSMYLVCKVPAMSAAQSGAYTRHGQRVAWLSLLHRARRAAASRKRRQAKSLQSARNTRGAASMAHTRDLARADGGSGQEVWQSTQRKTPEAPSLLGSYINSREDGAETPAKARS